MLTCTCVSIRNVCSQQKQATMTAQLQNSRAVQASDVAGTGQREKVAEQEKVLEHKTHEIEQLTVGSECKVQFGREWHVRECFDDSKVGVVNEVVGSAKVSQLVAICGWQHTDKGLPPSFKYGCG